MLDPGWAIRTPDANDLLLKGGTGPATMLTALAAYTAEMAATEVAAGVSLTNMGALNAQFQGATNISSTTAVTGLNTAAHLIFGWLAEKPPIITTAVNAYTTAYSAMIPAPLCVANREEWAVFNALNIAFPGMFLPQVVALDSQYFGHFWPNNTSTGATYSATLVSLIPALALPPPITPPGASPAAPAAAATAVAESAATGAAGEAMRASSQAAAQAASGGQAGLGSFTDIAGQALQPLQKGFEAVPKAFESFIGLPEKAMQPVMSLMQNFTGMFGGALNGPQTGAFSAEALRPGGVGAPSVTSLGPTAGGGGGGGVGGVGAAQGLTSYTRPVSSFGQDSGGRPTGLRTPGLLSTAELRGPTAVGTGGGAMPMAPAGMLARGQGADGDQQEVTRARIVVEGDRTDRE
ncbi:PPE domain-containing protein [Mycobacterium sp. ACS4331]|uniref:PPE domain-containing protein n=1 Tax=Mycobacterium sp. ACS4331 TaxID=1834121 RepID=UPI0007FD6556|nr:PPE domain-containing protein [Mycobacterium sp. ACS4331]OBF25938.1 hypothetical protein A5727_03835 [Mycobacterium sp. ACS4331]